MTSAVVTSDDQIPASAQSSRPPFWLVAATAALALLILFLAVAESGLKVQYLVDSRGEFISVFGLAFIACAGGYLAYQRRLASSLPLVFPWLLYPVVTQGDQIIDNLSINPMRAVCQVLLAAIFATPVAVIVLGVRGWLPADRRRQHSTMIAAALMALEIWLAELYLGRLMIASLIVMIVGVLAYGMMAAPAAIDVARRRQRSERFALAVLVVGVVGSLATYLGYKNAPGAYQGSPSFYMDPGEQGAAYSLGRVPVGDAPVAAPASPEAVRAALDADAATLQRLLDGYHLLERNYTWDFHNELFLRSWPLVPNYRQAGLAMIADARRMRADADAKTAAARATLGAGDPLAGLLDDVSGYMAWMFIRATRIEGMVAEFQKTQAGLQHAAHIYEGEAKYLGIGLDEILKKHDRVLHAAAAAPVTRNFARRSSAIYEAYADHIVGF